MRYAEHYRLLVDSGRERVSGLYTERHHIVPRCLGGGDEPANLVALSAREHYIAHLLLVKMYPSAKSLVYAAHMMTIGRNGRRIGNRKYEWLRRRHSRATSEAKRGNRYKIGTHHTPETRAKISASNKGRNSRQGVRLSPETKARISQAHMGRHRPELFRERCSEAHLAKSATPGITRRPNGKYVARKRINGQRVYVGYFGTLAEAEQAIAAS